MVGILWITWCHDVMTLWCHGFQTALVLFGQGCILGLLQVCCCPHLHGLKMGPMLQLRDLDEAVVTESDSVSRTVIRQWFWTTCFIHQIKRTNSTTSNSTKLLWFWILKHAFMILKKNTLKKELCLVNGSPSLW